nr:MAG TPA: hypothetical protein [Caudoviricetes sp.]
MKVLKWYYDSVSKEADRLLLYFSVLGPLNNSLLIFLCVLYFHSTSNVLTLFLFSGITGLSKER